MEESAKSQIRNFIIENFLYGDMSLIFSDEDSLLKKRIIDSVGILELVTFLQEKYGITVEDHEISPENLDSIHCLVEYLRRKSALPCSERS